MRRACGPTRAVSPRQLPTDHDYAVATREYQSDQPSIPLTRHYRCCILNLTTKRRMATCGCHERVGLTQSFHISPAPVRGPAAHETRTA
jgi:hypothetical protein